VREHEQSNAFLFLEEGDEATGGHCSELQWQIVADQLDRRERLYSVGGVGTISVFDGSADKSLHSITFCRVC